MRTPRSISKSLARALQCPRFFVLSHLADGIPAIEPGAMATTGSDFHAWRAAYVQHLISFRMESDPEWAERYLDSHAVEADAAELITNDARYFRIDPERVFATELFLGAGQFFRPTEMEENATPGRRPEKEETRYHGTLDYVEIHGTRMLIRDPKSGWLRRPTGDYEALHYAGLAFAHFDYITEIDWEWEYIRAQGARVPLHFTRDDLEWIHQRMRSNLKAMEAMVARYQSGDREPPIDSTAGLCPICSFSCPAKTAVQKGYIDSAPLQTLDDAKALVKIVHTASIVNARGRDLLSQWIDKHGPISAGPDLVAEIDIEPRDTFKLSDVLKILGLVDEPLPEDTLSPKYAVPLHSLKVSATDLKSKAKAKKRAGMREEMDAIRVRLPHSELHVGRPREKKAVLRDS